MADGPDLSGGGSPRVTAAVLARDEEDFLDGCLVSLGWADEILVVVDDQTRDATATVAARYTERVVTCAWQGFPHQRNQALDLAGCDWVLFVDADERVPPSLAAEVRHFLAGAGPGTGDAPSGAGLGAGDAPSGAGSHATGAPAGAWIPRRNVIAGRWARWAGWWPDRQLRLLDRQRARYDESALVHEVAALTGPAVTLGEPLLHLNYESLGEFRSKQRRYASLEARALLQQGTRARGRSLVGQPARELRRRLIDLRGYRQGPLGLALAAEMARARLETYRELRRLQQAEG